MNKKKKEGKEMKKYFVITVVLLLVIQIVSVFSPIRVNAEARRDIDLAYYGDSESAWEAVVAGEVDFMQWSLTKEQKEAAEENPDIQLARVDELGIFEFDINNNYTIPSYSGVRSPTHHVNVRRAIAHLVDKDYIIREILQYYGSRIDVPIPASLSHWVNENVVGANYDPEAAALLLAAVGFSDTDGNGWLNYPADWDGAPGADTTEYPLVVCVRSDHGHRLQAGLYLINQLEFTLALTSIGAGFKTTGTTWVQPKSVLAPKIMAKDFHVYTGGWSVGKWPPVYMFYMFHSMFWCTGNFITGVDKYGNPNYPDLDGELALAYYAPDIPTAEIHCDNAQALLVAVHCVSIWLWSYSSYWAYRKELVGVVNMNGIGLANQYTWLNAYRIDRNSIRVGLVFGPSRLNILYSIWYSEWCFLNIIYNHLLSEQPYNLAVIQPWVAQDFEVDTWIDPQDGQEKTLVTYYLRKDVGIVAPVTGNYIRRYTANDLEFSIWYIYNFTDSWQWGTVADVKYTIEVDVNGDGWNELQVFFDNLSYWSPLTLGEGMPLLVKDELLPLLCKSITESWTQIGIEPHLLDHGVVHVSSAGLDGHKLVEGVDYIIKAGYDLYSHIEFYPLRDLTGTISITYWYADIPATGFYLAGLPWQQTMYAICTHYPVYMTSDPPGVGDAIFLNKNPFFFICPPPLLGEIDWAWEWVGTTAPRSGRYAIRIFDVVRATGAYSTKGDGLYNDKWFPGADLDSSDLCHIGILDLVSITGKFGKTFGEPPESYHELMESGVYEVIGYFPDLIDATDITTYGVNLNIDVDTLIGEVKARVILMPGKGTGQVIYKSALPRQWEKINIEVIPPWPPTP